MTKEPPKYPFAINAQLSAQGEKLYAQYCANCHGRNGRDFSGEYVGDVVPVEKIGTDRHRLDSYTEELAAAQNTLYAGYPWRFSHFRKTYGYANAPLDGIWLRAPYLHNGSVPTLRDLLNASAERPQVFYRGYDVFDQAKVGFVSEPAHFTDDGRSKDDPQKIRATTSASIRRRKQQAQRRAIATKAIPTLVMKAQPMAPC